MSAQPGFDTLSSNPMENAETIAPSIAVVGVRVLGPVAAAMAYLREHPEYARDMLEQIYQSAGAVVQSAAAAGAHTDSVAWGVGRAADFGAEAAEAALAAKTDESATRHTTIDVRRTSSAIMAPTPAEVPAHGWNRSTGTSRGLGRAG